MFSVRVKGHHYACIELGGNGAIIWTGLAVFWYKS